MKTLDLNCAAPDEVAKILRNAAEAYRQSRLDLQDSWQDKNAGKPWTAIARILEQAADKVDKVSFDY